MVKVGIQQKNGSVAKFKNEKQRMLSLRYFMQEYPLIP